MAKRGAARDRRARERRLAVDFAGQRRDPCYRQQGVKEPIDIVAEMDRDPGTRPVCARLTAGHRKALRLRRGPGGKGLKARRLACPGDGIVLTPMGEQWREDMLEIERMRRALQRALEMLRDGAERQDVLDVVVGGLG